MQGWMMHSGPDTAAELAMRLQIPINEIEQSLLRLESTGAVLRGTFTSTSSRETLTQSPDHAITQSLNQTEWCERRLLARIHRRTVSELRKQIEQVTAA